MERTKKRMTQLKERMQDKENPSKMKGNQGKVMKRMVTLVEVKLKTKTRKRKDLLLKERKKGKSVISPNLVQCVGLVDLFSFPLNFSRKSFGQIKTPDKTAERSLEKGSSSPSGKEMPMRRWTEATYGPTLSKKQRAGAY